MEIKEGHQLFFYGYVDLSVCMLHILSSVSCVVCVCVFRWH